MDLPEPLTPTSLHDWTTWLFDQRPHAAPPEAVERAMAAARRFGASDDATRLMLVLSREAHVERRFARSRTWLDEARTTAVSPTMVAHVGYRYARYHLAMGDRDRAHDAYLRARDRAWDCDPALAREAWLDAVSIRIERGDHSELEALTRCIRDADDDHLGFRLDFVRFRAAMATGDLDRGAQVLEEMHATYREPHRLALVKLNQGTLALLAEDPERGDRLARAAIEITPQLREAMLLRGRAAARNGDGAQALAWMDELVRERPDAALRGVMRSYITLTRVAGRVACDAPPSPTDLVTLGRTTATMFSMPAMEGLEALRWATEDQAPPSSPRRQRCVRLLAMAHALLTVPLPAHAAAIATRLRHHHRDGAGVPVGPWTLVAPIAQGAQGAVWRAHHLGTGQPAAVKIPHDPDASSSDDELEAIARLSHPGVVALYDHGRLPHHAEGMTGGRLRGGAPWIAMELVEGGSLRAACGRRPWPDVKAVARALLDALAHAHARDVLHLDVKPHNVLLQASSDGVHAKLTDFGLASSAHRARGRVVGTPAYMSPEQARGQWRALGPPADLFGLGATLWHLITGSPPWPDADLPVTRPPLPELRAAFPVPEGLNVWLGRLLAPSPGDRFATAAHAARALMALPASTRTTAPAPAPQAVAGVGTTIVLGASDDRPQALSQASSAWFELPRELVPATSGRPQRPAGDRLLSPRPTLQGRDELQAALWEEVHQTIQDVQPRAVVVAGPQGVGVTAVLEWLGERASEQGVRWLTVETGAPWAAQIERWTLADGLVGDARAQQMAAMLRCHPDRPWVQRLARTDHTDVALVAHALGVWARDRPVVVTVDDAHASPAAHALARQLLRGGAAVLVALGYRTTDPPPATPLPEATRFDVGPLPDAHVAAALDAVAPLHPATRAALTTAAAGSVGAALTQLEQWLAEHQLWETEQGWRRPVGADQPLPRDHAAWRERWRKAAGGATPWLRVRIAATLGARFEQPVWRRACEAMGLPAAKEEALAARLVRAGLWARDGIDGVRFTVAPAHRAAVLDDPDVHGACAQAVPPTYAERLAHHLERAGRGHAALEALERAADAALRAGDIGTTWLVLQRVESLLDRQQVRDDDPRWSRLWRRQADAYEQGGQVTPRLQAAERAVAAAQRGADAEELARCRAVWARAARRVGDHDTARLAAADIVADPAVPALLRARAAWLLAELSEGAARDDWHHDAERWWQDDGRPEAHADLHAARARRAAADGRPEDAVVHWRRAAETYTSSGHIRRAGRAWSLMATSLRLSGAFPEALDALHRGAALLGAEASWVVDVTAASLHWLLRAHDTARQHLDAASRGLRHGRAEPEQIAAVGLVQLLMGADDDDEAGFRRQLEALWADLLSLPFRHERVSEVRWVLGHAEAAARAAGFEARAMVLRQRARQVPTAPPSRDDDATAEW